MQDVKAVVADDGRDLVIRCGIRRDDEEMDISLSSCKMVSIRGSTNEKTGSGLDGRGRVVEAVIPIGESLLFIAVAYIPSLKLKRGERRGSCKFRLPDADSEATFFDFAI